MYIIYPNTCFAPLLAWFATFVRRLDDSRAYGVMVLALLCYSITTAIALVLYC